MPLMFNPLRRRAAVACLAVVVAAALAQESLAQESLVREAISEDVAVALVREQTDGKVVRVDRKMEGGALVYRVRVLSPDGRLREYRVDAATGAVR
jgi:uncharacterized membrane protein YkoI